MSAPAPLKVDAKAIALQALAAARPHLEAGADDLVEFRFSWSDLEADVARTLERSVLATNAQEREQLAEDLARYLPARRKALVSIAASHASGNAQAAFAAALDVAVKVVVGIGKALVGGIV